MGRGQTDGGVDADLAFALIDCADHGIKHNQHGDD